MNTDAKIAFVTTLTETLSKSSNTISRKSLKTLEAHFRNTTQCLSEHVQLSFDDKPFFRSRFEKKCVFRLSGS